jgi:hypothetical protein
MTGFYALFTHPPLETPLLVQLACVKHAASIHPELARIELSIKFLVSLVIAYLFLIYNI